MKCLIVNAKSFNYTDKKTGELVPAIVLDVVKNTLGNSSGKGVTNLFIGKNFNEALYNTLSLTCNGDFNSYSNQLCNVDFDENKNIVAFEFIKTEKPAVTWGF